MATLDVDKDELLSMVAMHAGTILGAIRTSGEHCTDPGVLRSAAEVLEAHSKRLSLVGPMLAEDMRTAAEAYEKKLREMANAAQESQGATRQ